MPQISKPNCQHLDRWNCCRIHKMPGILAWFFPNWRPRCVLYVPPWHDEAPTCADQVRWPRPNPPASWRGISGRRSD